jgi:hypothetical protein
LCPLCSLREFYSLFFNAEILLVDLLSVAAISTGCRI